MVITTPPLHSLEGGPHAKCSDGCCECTEVCTHVYVQEDSNHLVGFTAREVRDYCHGVSR